MLALAPPAVTSGVPSRSRVLVLGPTSPDSSAVRAALENCRLEGAEVACVLCEDDVWHRIPDHTLSAILLDLHGPDALERAVRLREELPRVRVILFHSRPGHLICLEVLAPRDGNGRECDGSAPDAAALSARQLEILRHLASGLSVKEIAHAMRMSYKSVDSLKYRLMRRLSIHDRVGLTRYAIREGLVTP